MVLPRTNFTGVPEAVVYLDSSVGPFYRVSDCLNLFLASTGPSSRTGKQDLLNIYMEVSPVRNASWIIYKFVEYLYT